MKNKTTAILVVLALLFTTGGCGSAEQDSAPSGAEVFRQYYGEKAGNDSSYTNLDQLEAMASSTVGTAVDTEELRVEVLGALISGNTAEILLRVTAKQLDSVLYDNGSETLPNYRFNDEIYSLATATDSAQLSCWNVYSDEDESLAPNQFLIHYSLMSREDLSKESYSIGFTNFGYFDFGKSNRFVTLYEGSWTVSIAADPAADSSRHIAPGEEVTIGEPRFTLEDIVLTPLGCTLRLTSHGDANAVNTVVDEARRDCALTLTDGTVLRDGQFEIGGSGIEEEYLLLLSFKVPVAVEDMAALTFPAGVEWRPDGKSDAGA